MAKQYSRPLPHWQRDRAAYFVTWRLCGSLPRIARPDPLMAAGERFVKEDRFLDSNPKGPQWLGIPGVATVVIHDLLEGAGRGQYELGPWVLMPNHIHLVLRPRFDLAVVMSALKSSTARDANLVLNRSGKAFWARNYFDRWIRNSDEEAKITRYIEQNPVKAGMCSEPEDWPWSSRHAAFAASPYFRFCQAAFR